jgi:signal transduction histidine kinase
MVADSEVILSDDRRKMEVKGVLGLIIDVTDMKARAKLELDNARLTAEEQAAKYSNRMKSQFLANVRPRPHLKMVTDRSQMSHELRTPTSVRITVVICRYEANSYRELSAWWIY